MYIYVTSHLTCTLSGSRTGWFAVSVILFRLASNHSEIFIYMYIHVTSDHFPTLITLHHAFLTLISGVTLISITKYRGITLISITIILYHPLTLIILYLTLPIFRLSPFTIMHSLPLYCLSWSLTILRLFSIILYLTLPMFRLSPFTIMHHFPTLITLPLYCLSRSFIILRLFSIIPYLTLPISRSHHSPWFGYSQ